MATLEHHNFARGHLVQDEVLPQHTLTGAASTRSGMSMSLPTTMAYDQDYWHHSSPYYTPRSIAPHPGYFPSFATHDYPQGETYAISSNSTRTRGRSGSGASTASGGYTVVSPRTAPASPLLRLSGAGSQYQATHGDRISQTEGLTSNTPGKPSSQQFKQEPLSVRRAQAQSLANVKTIFGDRMFCSHADCLDEKGQPRRFFSRKADVTRHHKSRHEITYIDCPRNNCERKGRQGFTRRDHLTEHLRGFHMVKIAKRHTKVKREEKESHDDSKGPNSSAEDLTPKDSAAELLHAAGSRDSTLGSQGDQDFKQEFPTSSDEDAEDSFVADDGYQPATTQGVRKASKSKASRSHPYQRSPSKPQPQDASSDGNMPHHTSLSPEVVTSSMAPHSPVYATHPTMGGGYTNSDIMSEMLSTNPYMECLYASSRAQGYHGLPAPYVSSFRPAHPDDFRF
ncbi:hypothetical protein PV04_05033 [Phialophora macrospora]|uniref:C2H2-type domain-containing protein n=1 Tax=Phialophora macrospora TaxID=1851006 RepID=A0A0D2FRG0_9EURO|nr:hypothetical protein PV04_05033 [Phialophora macrospora]